MPVTKTKDQARILAEARRIRKKEGLSFEEAMTKAIRKINQENRNKK